MKLAIEHIQQKVAQTERSLSEAREGLKVAQRTLDERTEDVGRQQALLADLVATLALLRASPTQAGNAPVAQITKTELAERQPRQTLSRGKGN